MQFNKRARPRMPMKPKTTAQDAQKEQVQGSADPLARRQGTGA